MKTLVYSLFAVVALTLPHVARGTASAASDNAANYVGQATYTSTNGGTGFPAGFQSSSSGTRIFLGSSGQIDTSGLSFGLTANSSSETTVSRYFGPYYDGSMDVGQMFRLQLQPSTVAQGGILSFSLLPNISFGTSLYLSYNSGNTDYILSLREQISATQANTRVIDTGVPFSATALTMVYTQNSGSFTLALTPFGGATTSITQTSVGQPYGFNLSAYNSTFYFNNISVVPEPGSSVVLTLGLLGGLLVLSRRRRTA